MKNQKFVTDDWFVTLLNKVSFKNQLDDMEENREFVAMSKEDIKANKISFNALPHEPLFASVYADKYSINDEIIIDTMNNSNAIALINGSYVALRDTALRDAVEKAGFTCPVASKLQSERLCELLNEFILVTNKPVVINKTYGKITSIVSDIYKYVPESELFTEFEKTAEKNLGRLIFNSSYIDCTTSRAMYTVDNPDLIETYTKSVSEEGRPVLSTNYYPQILVSTGSSGETAMRVITYLSDDDGRCVPIGNGISVPHKGDDAFTKFKEELNFLYPRFIKNIKKLSELKDITIYHPVSCAYNLFKKIGISNKKFAKSIAEVLNTISVFATSGTIDAENLYWLMSEISLEAKKNGATVSELSVINENLYKFLHLDIKSFDYEAKSEVA